MLGSIAEAQTLPEDNSAIDEYLPALPEAGGSTPAGGGPGSRTEERGSSTRGGSDGRAAAYRLPADVRRRLPPGAEGDLLATVASSPGLGAPPPGEARARAAVRSPERAPASEPGLLASLSDFLFDGEHPWVPVGLLALLVVAAGGVAAGRRRGRSLQ